MDLNYLNYEVELHEILTKTPTNNEPVFVIVASDENVTEIAYTLKSLMEIANEKTEVVILYETLSYNHRSMIVCMCKDSLVNVDLQYIKSKQQDVHIRFPFGTYSEVDRISFMLPYIMMNYQYVIYIKAGTFLQKGSLKMAFSEKRTCIKVTGNENAFMIYIDNFALKKDLSIKELFSKDTRMTVFEFYGRFSTDTLEDTTIEPYTANEARKVLQNTPFEEYPLFYKGKIDKGNPIIPYYYLFPFEKVKQGAKVALYGAGTVGRFFYEQLEKSSYCSEVVVIDSNSEMHKCDDIKVYSTEILDRKVFDYIIVSVASKKIFCEIEEYLITRGINEEIIIGAYDRKVEL